jgi:hypothetical protein
MLYWLVVRCKSLAKEKSCALPMFTLLKHSIQHGITKRSNATYRSMKAIR